MTITIQKVGFSEQMSGTEGKLVSENPLGLFGGVEVTCFVRLGTLTLTIAELSQLQEGQTMALHQKTHEPVDIILNDEVIARGELMCCDENFAIQILEVCSS